MSFAQRLKFNFGPTYYWVDELIVDIDLTGHKKDELLARRSYPVEIPDDVKCRMFSAYDYVTGVHGFGHDILMDEKVPGVRARVIRQAEYELAKVRTDGFVQNNLSKYSSSAIAGYRVSVSDKTKRHKVTYDEWVKIHDRRSDQTPAVS